jgi:hypothetical protein
LRLIYFLGELLGDASEGVAGVADVAENDSDMSYRDSANAAGGLDALGGDSEMS